MVDYFLELHQDTYEYSEYSNECNLLKINEAIYENMVMSDTFNRFDNNLKDFVGRYKEDINRYNEKDPYYAGIPAYNVDKSSFDELLFKYTGKNNTFNGYNNVSKIEMYYNNPAFKAITGICLIVGVAVGINIYWNTGQI